MQCQDISVKLFLMNKKTKPKIEVQLERETFKLKANKGGGILSFEVWGYVQDGKTIVTRYNLAYINPLICQKDNGRVLGFDNAHNYHHRHYMGKVAPVEFENYEQTLEQFQEEWQQIVKGLKKVNRSDQETNEHIHWVELKNVNGKAGWLYGDADFFSFEIKDYWLVVDKVDLQRFIAEKCREKIRVSKPELYKLYQRKDRKDIITLVSSYDLCYICTKQIKKNNL